MSGLAGVAVKFPGWWTRVYTTGLPVETRDARRDEIASDIHDQLHDPDEPAPAGSLAFEVALAVVRGAPHDLMWRTALLSPGWWIAEVACLVIVMGFSGAVFTLSALYITGLLQGLPSIVAGATVGVGLGLWMAFALRRHRPLDLFMPEAIEPPIPSFEGDPPMPHSFRTWAGLSAIVAATIQLAVIGGFMSVDINPYSEPAEMLTLVDDNTVVWALTTLGTAAVPLFMLPLFVVLATDAGTGARQWGMFAVVLVALFTAINALANGTLALLIPLANDYASASAGEQTSLLQQTDLLQSAWVVFRIIAGLPFMMGMFIAAVMCFRLRVFPRWLGVVAAIIGVQFAPPVGGEFILVAPAMVVWCIGAGFILIRGRFAPAAPALSGPLSAASAAGV